MGDGDVHLVNVHSEDIVDTLSEDVIDTLSEDVDIEMFNANENIIY